MNIPSDLPSQLELLRQFNLSIRQQLELAEARIPTLNEQIDQLARTELIQDIALVGNVIYNRAYTMPGTADGGTLLQAAVLLPGGLGLVEWDFEEHLSFRDPYEPSFADIKRRFRAFDELEPALKALLLPQVECLLDRLLSMTLPTNPTTRPSEGGWTNCC